MVNLLANVEPSRARGLKLPKEHVAPGVVEVEPSRARGLQHALAAHAQETGPVEPSRARGLKLEEPFSDWLRPRRALTGSRVETRM